MITLERLANSKFQSMDTAQEDQIFIRGEDRLVVRKEGESYRILVAYRLDHKNRVTLYGNPQELLE